MYHVLLISPCPSISSPFIVVIHLWTLSSLSVFQDWKQHAVYCLYHSSVLIPSLGLSGKSKVLLIYVSYQAGCCWAQDDCRCLFYPLIFDPFTERGIAVIWVIMAKTVSFWCWRLPRIFTFTLHPLHTFPFYLQNKYWACSEHAAEPIPSLEWAPPRMEWTADCNAYALCSKTMSWKYHGDK